MSSFSKVYIENIGNTFEDNVSEVMCRGCFETNKAMKNINTNNLKIFLLEVADIKVVESGQWLCWECEALLYKFVRFRRKLQRRHHILQQYATNQTIPSNVLKEELSITRSSTMMHTPVLWIACTEFGFTDIQVFSSNDAISRPISVVQPLFNFKEEIKKEIEITLPIKEELPSFVRNNSPELIDYDYEENPTVKEDTNENEQKSCQRQSKTIRKRRQCRDNNLESNSLTGGNGSHTSDEDDNMSLAFHKKHDKSKLLKHDETKIKRIILSEQQYMIERQKKLLSNEFLHFPFRCSHCVKGFNFKEKLENHMRLHDKKLRPYECSICLMRFSVINLMETHKKKHGVRFKCQQCEYTSTDKLCAMRHYNSRHEGGTTLALACKYCKKTYRKARSLRSHEESHISKTIASCDICGKTYSHQASLLKHTLTHTAKKDLFACDICGKGFAQRALLTMHLRRHKNETGDFYCVQCEKFFKSKGILKAHLSMSSKHTTSDHIKHKCDQCDRAFQFPLSLKNHKLFFHTNKKKYQCKRCEHVFVTLSGLTRHLRVKHDDTPLPRKYMCHTCGKGFSFKSILEEHIRIHTGERPFKCDECGKSFTQNATMRTHIKLVHQKLKRDTKKK